MELWAGEKVFQKISAVSDSWSWQSKSNIQTCLKWSLFIFTFSNYLQVKSLDPYNDLYDNWGLGAYDRFTGLKLYNPNLKTYLAVGGWNEGGLTNAVGDIFFVYGV